MELTECEMEILTLLYNKIRIERYDIGSYLFDDFQNIYNKIRYNDYCTRNHIKYEDMTDLNIESAEEDLFQEPEEIFEEW